MIFGTTGLTNFAHGELITFGALVAYWASTRLPGTIHIGGANSRSPSRSSSRSWPRRRFGWLKDTGCGGRCAAAAPA